MGIFTYSAIIPPHGRPVLMAIPKQPDPRLLLMLMTSGGEVGDESPDDEVPEEAKAWITSTAYLARGLSGPDAGGSAWPGCFKTRLSAAPSSCRENPFRRKSVTPSALA